MATITATVKKFLNENLASFLLNADDAGNGFGTLFEAAQTSLATAVSQLAAAGGVPVITLGYQGARSVAQINALTPGFGHAYTLSDAGTLTLGTVTVTVGDLVEFNGTSWVVLAQAVNSYVPSGTVVIVGTGTLVSPIASATAGSVATFGGASNTPTVAAATSGDFRRVKKGPDASSVWVGRTFVFTSAAWLETSRAPYPRFVAPAAAADRITNTASLTAFTNTLKLPPNFFSSGAVYEVEALVFIAGVTGTPTITITLRLDGNAAVSLASSTAVAANDVLYAKFRLQATGAGASVIALVETKSLKSLAGTVTVVNSGLVNAAFDTTAGHTVDVTAQWSAASTSNQADLRILRDNREIFAAMA